MQPSLSRLPLERSHDGIAYESVEERGTQSREAPQEFQLRAK
jgi:hypothetical protein